MKKALALILLMTVNMAANAGTGQGVIRSIWASPVSPYVMFDFTTPIEDSHMCNRSKRFSIDTTVIGGMHTYRTLILAKSEGLSVSVQGLGTCNIHDAENVKWLKVD